MTNSVSAWVFEDSKELESYLRTLFSNIDNRSMGSVRHHANTNLFSNSGLRDEFIKLGESMLNQR